MKFLLALSFLFAAVANAQSVELTSFAQPPGGPVQPGTLDREVLQFRLYRATGSPSVDCTEVRISHLGTAAPTDWTAIKLYKDADHSGDINGDPLLATTTSLTAGQAVLAGFAEPLGEGFSAGTDFLAAVDVAAGATPDNTFQFKLVPADVDVSAGTVSGPASGVTGNVHTVRVDSGAEIGVLLGTTPLISGTAGATNIGQVPQTGGAITLMIENTGINPLLLTGTPTIAVSSEMNCSAVVNGTPATMIDPSQNITVVIDILPATAAAFSFRIDIGNNDFDEHPFVQVFNGTAAPEPILSLEYNSAAVPKGGTVQVGTFTAGVASQINFTISNSGSGDLLLTGTPVVAVPSESNVTATALLPPTSPVAPAGSTVFTIEIVPVGSGNWLFQLYIESNDPMNNPYTAVVQGDSPAVTPTEIRFVQQPAGAYAGFAFLTPAIIAVTDANGAVDHSNNTVQVAASITPGSGPGGASLNGSPTRTAVGGYLIFTDLALDKPGAAYTLTFAHSNGAFASVASAPFDVSKPPEPDNGEEDDNEGNCSTSSGRHGTWLFIGLGLALSLARGTRAWPRTN